MPAYYNENDPYCVAWLRNLIKAGLIAPGEVDDRSIIAVRPDDLIGFDQCHFFAGIGGWSYAARLAGWPDDRPLWTGSCPCQPFSVAGKGKAEKDRRHLWPPLFELLRARRPDVFMGEQVASSLGKAWLDRVLTDLEGIAYTARAAVIPACAVGTPHRRDRLWIVADPNDIERSLAGSGRRDAGQAGEWIQGHGAPSGYLGREHVADAGGKRFPAGRDHDAGDVGAIPAADGQSGGMADPGGLGWQGRESPREAGERRRSADEGGPALGDVADAHHALEERQRGLGWPPEGGPLGMVTGRGRARARAVGNAGGKGLPLSEPQAPGRARRGEEGRAVAESGLAPIRAADAGDVVHAPGGRWDQGLDDEAAGYGRPSPPDAWADAWWLAGADGKTRRIGPGIRVLAHGVRKRVAKLRALGNAIVPQVAAEVILAWIEETERLKP